MKIALLACGNPEHIRSVCSILSGTYRLDVARDRRECLRAFRTQRYDVTLLDVAILTGGGRPDGPVDYRKALEPFRTAFPHAQIVVLADDARVREAVNAVRAGAADYLTFPMDSEELRFALQGLRESVRTEAELEYLREESWPGAIGDLTRARSDAMRELVSQLRLVAPTRTTVLLTGETGTGKGVLARAIHQLGPRRDGPFVCVHCGAIPDTLVESELFGHEKGAFTGADARRLGKFEVAHGGTVFLDEVATLSAAAQVKLLQVLQERTLQRVGSDRVVEVDVRVIAATNVDLPVLCHRGTFRRDLYYRLNVFPLHVPPLRERREDIPLLVEALLAGLCGVLDIDMREVAPSVLGAFQVYSWPGNVRELENVLERAAILEQGGRLLREASFPREIIAAGLAPAPDEGIDTSLTLEEAQQRAVDDVRRRYLQAQLARCQGRITRTAQAAGIGARHLNGLMRRYGLRKEDFRSASAGDRKS